MRQPEGETRYPDIESGGDDGATERVEIVRLVYLPWQREVRNALLRGVKTVVMANGARSGKGRVSANLMLEFPLRCALARQRRKIRLVPRVNNWVVAPTQKYFRQSWDELNDVIPSSMIVKRNYSDKLIVLRGDIQYKFKSAYDSKSLVAEGIDYLWFTEASREMDPVAWQESLLPRLYSPGRMGVAIVEGTPRNRRGHWFRQLFDLAANGNDPSMAAWNLPTTCNPLMGAGAIAALAKRMPKRLFNTEILAIWPGDDDVPFRDLDLRHVFVGGNGQMPKGPFINAIDIARYRNETWISAMTLDDIPQVVWCRRMVNMKVQKQIDEIEKFNLRFPGPLIFDSTNTGGAYFQDLLEERMKRRCVRVTGYDFHGSRKEDLCDGLVYGVENHAFIVRTDLLKEEDHTELLEQFRLFECDIDEENNVDYHGPGGERDDGVISVGLAWYKAQFTPRNRVNTFNFRAVLRHFFADADDRE